MMELFSAILLIWLGFELGRLFDTFKATPPQPTMDYYKKYKVRVKPFSKKRHDLRTQR